MKKTAFQPSFYFAGKMAFEYHSLTLANKRKSSSADRNGRRAARPVESEAPGMKSSNLHPQAKLEVYLRNSISQLKYG
ncbi:hypothetical protein SD77_1721 [Bacillus badius]|uniref:Ribose 5-phosphate isomerase B n=1 Tax=Bacillus badius TaxID=1455 RepID=A0ABR5ARY3_BACBA|nr:hypothetical protein SD77_1721 [Bacillus badius]